VQQAIREAVAQLSAASDTPRARAEAMHEELSNVTAKLDRLTQAVVLGGDLPSLVAEMKAWTGAAPTSRRMSTTSNRWEA